MIFKRFKTLLFKYIDADPRVSSSTQYVLYLDINNVISNPLDVFFGDYHNKVNDELQKSGVTTNLFNHSYISFWVDPVKERDHFQGGQFMVHQNNGRGCLDAWRHQMDTVPMEMDQPLLMNVVKIPRNTSVSHLCSLMKTQKRSISICYNPISSSHQKMNTQPSFIYNKWLPGKDIQ
jgi:hypothetical protein